MKRSIYPVRERRRRDAAIKAYGRRGQITAGKPPRPLDRAFLRRLHDLDPALELIWHPIQNHWCLYRCARKVGGSEDILILVSGIKDWPGDWLIDFYRKQDLARRHPEANTPDRIGKLEMDRMDRADEEVERQRDKDLTSLHERLADDLRPVCRAREMEIANETPLAETEDPNPKRKVIWKNGAPTASNA